MILGVKSYLILVLRNQFFEYLWETLYEHALEHLEAARPEKKMQNWFLPTETADYIIVRFEGLRLVGTQSSGVGASPRSLTKKN